MDPPSQAIETKNTVARFLGNGVVVPSLQIWTVILEPLRIILQIVYRLWTAFQVCRLEMHWGIQHLSYAESGGESLILSHAVKRNRNNGEPRLNHLALSESESHIMYSNGSKGKSSSFEPLFFNLQSQHLNECKAFLIQRTHFLCDPDPSSTEVLDQSQSSCDSPFASRQEETFGEFPVKDSREAVGTVINNPKLEQLESLSDDKAGESEDDSWDEDESSCQEWDTEENRKLWECFVNAADTYNPFNFSACISSCPQKKQSHPNETHCLKGEARENSSFSSDSEEVAENQNYCFNFGQNCSETETEEDDWDSSSNCSASDQEENNKLWDSFVNPTDPYSPLHFTACTASTSTTQKMSECLNKHTGPVKVPAKKCLTLANSTKDSGYDSQSISDEESNSEDEDSCEKLNKKLWDLFSQSSDPYNLLNFRACLKSCPTDNKSEDNGVRNETNGTGPVKATSVKPNLPKRHFKHYCQNKSKDNQQFLTWKKPAKVAARRTEEKEEKDIVKKVTFSPVVHVHVMHAWDFALRAARKSPWEEMARDRARFQRRIQEAEETIGCCWSPDHREKIQTRLSAEDSVAPTVLT
ncbi:protein phosphatase 1 regulatory subunit 15B-like isoform X1 [Acipenser ruthenus]|uniref:protein phosphatase 1 regulatory subunit 15B-like isoform X1 n=1 Tax=Acipenser ruthenus TaxID=7906 RepID=UPI00145A07EA|nr:protein phosphatase 1 regulatory subunit 15B-like isoform X1 [Acipenser ruthenus]